MDKTTKNTAWRWINLKEAELEDKMEVILFKNDPELYHRVKMMEMGKLEDQLSDEFNVCSIDFLQVHEKLQIADD